MLALLMGLRLLGVSSFLATIIRTPSPIISVPVVASSPCDEANERARLVVRQQPSTRNGEVIWILQPNVLQKSHG